MKKLTLLLIVLNLVGFSMGSYAASFNCAAAQTKTEYTICNNLSLNDADVKMATTYHIVRKLVPMGNRGAIQDQQIAWLALRNQCQTQVSCLTKAYQMRQQQLEMVMQRVYQQGPF